MASFVIHTASAEQMLKGLKLNDEEKALFYAGNLLPDTSFQEKNKELPEEERRKLIQKEKIVSHFRKELEAPFQHPDLDFFLSKYKEQAKVDPLIFGIFYHLYIDCLFYRDFVPAHVQILDENKEPTNIRSKIKYYIVNKINRLEDSNEFFSYKGKTSIYSEYNRLNSYILGKYNICEDINKYINILDNYEMKSNIPEININEAHDILCVLKMIINRDRNNEKELLIFNEEEVINFIEESAINFINTYKDIYESYK